MQNDTFGFVFQVDLKLNILESFKFISHHKPCARRGRLLLEELFLGINITSGHNLITKQRHVWSKQ